MLIAAHIGIGLYLAGLSLFLMLRVLTGDRFWPVALLNNSAPYVVLPLLIVTPISVLLGSLSLLILSFLLLVLCAVWFSPYFLPKPRRTPMHPTLRIITFNMWGGNPMQSELTAWLRSQNADLIFLQEVPESFELDCIPALKPDYPYFYREQTAAKRWTNTIISKHPITSINDLDPSIYSISTRQRIVVEVSDRQLALYSIHLTFTNHEPRIRTNKWSIMHSISSFDDSQRNTELDCLLSELDRETLPYIVAGDFNMSAQSLTYRKLAAHLHDAFREVGFGLGGTWPNGGVLSLPDFVPPLLRIDYIWYCDHFRAITAHVGSTLGSDHRPVIVQLEFLPDEA